MNNATFVLRFVSVGWLALLAACGSRESSDGPAAESETAAAVESAPGGGDAAASGGKPLLISPLPQDAKLSLRFSASVAAERNQVDKDPLGPRSNFKVSRRVEMTCRMLATQPRGVGPDGPTPQQKAILDGAESQTAQVSEDLQPSPDMSAIEAKLEACGEDEGCRMQAALDIASDPDMQAQLMAQSTRNEALAAGLDDAASRASAVQTEPNWQLVVPDTAREGGKPVCDGVLSVDDKEVYRFGFDGGDMGEGVETRKGETVTADSPTFYVWYDLKRGGLIVDIQFSAIRGEVPSVNVGARANSRNADFGLNADWARSAGENTRFERASGVTTIPGKWTFALPITPTVHQGFRGKIEAEIAIGPR